MANVQQVVVGYNSALPESRELAELYLSRIGAPSTRAIALECSTDHVLSTYEDFRDTVELPLRGFASPGVSAYVLGYRVPVGFAHDGGFISACSRMSSPYALQPGKTNPLFNASGNTRASSYLVEGIIPCSSIDMPSVAGVRKLVEAAGINSLGTTVYGTLLLDPHPPSGVSHPYMTSALEEFEESMAADVFPNYRRSEVQPSPYDSSFPYTAGDSFFYGWGLQEANESYFVPQQEKRAVFFNADSGSIARVRPDDGGFAPCVSAASSGYAFVMGSVGSAPLGETDPYDSGGNEAGAPHPIPLFTSIIAGETTGEAWILASPRLDTPFGCIGCPFSRFTILKSVQKDRLPAAQVARETQVKLSQLIARTNHSAEAMDALFSRVATWGDRLIATRMMPTIMSMAKDNGVKARKAMLSGLITSYNQFISQVSYGQIHPNEPSFLEFMEATGNKISISLAEYAMGGQQWLKDMRYSTFEKPGSWMAEFQVADMDSVLGFIHFHAEIYNEQGVKVDEAKSYMDVTRWEYEAFTGRMQQIPVGGIFSGRVGATVRLSSGISGSSLRRSEIATVRIRQILNRHQTSDWVEVRTVATS